VKGAIIIELIKGLGRQPTMLPVSELSKGYAHAVWQLFLSGRLMYEPLLQEVHIPLKSLQLAQ